MSLRAGFRYRLDIDGLRAVAILAAILFHVGDAGLPGGFVGVDIFFVISGYLITDLLVRELAKTGTLSLRRFYARRVRRLLPTLALVMTTVILVAPGFFPPDAFRDLSASVLASLSLWGNFYFMNSTAGYFAGPHTGFPLLHLWSLAVEEQFYLMWPLFLIAIHRWGSREFRTKALAWMGALILISFALSEFLVFRKPKAAFFLMPPRSWELAVGGLIVFIPPIASFPLNTISALTGLATIVVVCLKYASDLPFPGLAAVLPVMGAALVLHAGHDPRSNMITRLLSQRPFVFIGQISYAWYLWHWPILTWLRLTNLGDEPPLMTKLGGMAGAFVLAWLTTWFLEKPIRYGRWWSRRSSFQIIMTGLITCLCLVFVTKGLQSWSQRRFEQNYGQLEIDQSVLGPDCHSVPGFQQFGSGHIAKICNVAQGTNTELVVWGDSFADPLFGMVHEGHPTPSSKFQVLLSRARSPSILGSAIQIEGVPTDTDFGDYNESVLKFIKQEVDAGKKVAVLLATRFMLYSGHDLTETLARRAQAIIVPPAGMSCSQNCLETQVLLTLKKLNDIGVQKILIWLPSVEFQWNVPRCLLLHPSDEAVCGTSREKMEAYRAQKTDALKKMAATFTNVRWVDPLAAVCDSALCPARLNGKPMSYDDNHPSAGAARIYRQRLHEELDWLQSEP